MNREDREYEAWRARHDWDYENSTRPPDGFVWPKIQGPELPTVEEYIPLPESPWAPVLRGMAILAAIAIAVLLWVGIVRGFDAFV